MLQGLLRMGRVLPAIMIASLLVACQPDRADHGIGDDAKTTTSRTIADALDWQRADSRKARISAVEYDLYVDVHSSTDWFSG